jgi:hypothetical protein
VSAEETFGAELNQNCRTAFLNFFKDHAGFHRRHYYKPTSREKFRRILTSG